MRPKILRLDTAGQPQGWMHWQVAAVLYANDKVAWTAGETMVSIQGGLNRLTGKDTFMEINSIVACRGKVKQSRFELTPPLNNRELFRRDSHLCLYCLNEMADEKLTRDHVIPVSQGGKNTWTNVVTACRSCNQRKGAQTPEQAKMRLHALPYTPNFAEWLTLKNRRILSDQMAFLKMRFSENNKLERNNH